MNRTEYDATQAVNPVPTRDGYDRWSQFYDGEGNPLIALEEPHLIELLGGVRGRDVADLGCGTGRHALRLAAAGARVTALDFSTGMVDQARRKPGWDAIRFIEHDVARPLPLPDAAFDTVLSALVLDHIRDLTGFFAECRRICRPDGFVLMSTVHPAMMLRGIRAHFTDPATGRDVHPESVPNQISDYVMAAARAGLSFDHMSEHAVDEALAAQNPRAAKYLGWPMLLVMRLRPV
jgi:malonyl-CoA O-methyltransferase